MIALFSLLVSFWMSPQHTTGKMMSFTTTQHQKHLEHPISIRAERAQLPEEVELAQDLGVGGTLQ